MKKSDLIELLGKYKPDDENEKKYKEQILDFLNENDVFLGKKNQIGHITGSSWIVNYDKTKALLTHHRKLDKWIQLGGHTEEDETILETAMREAQEESGLNSVKCLSEEIFDISIHKFSTILDVPEHFHYDIRFLFEADCDEKIIVSNESKDVKWVSLDRMAEYNADSSRMRMVKKTNKL